MATSSIHNVVDYDARGDGTGDDSAAINRALAASAVPLSGGLCHIPPGRFQVRNPITVSSGTHLVIDGTVVLADGANCTILQPNGARILIEGGGVLDGNAEHQTSKGIGGIANRGGTTPSQITIRDLTVVNVKAWGVNLTRCQGAVLERLTISGCGSASEFADDCVNCWARGLVVSNTNDYGFAFYGGVSQSGITDSRCYANKGPNIGVLSDPGQPAPCSDILIANNVCYAGQSNGIGIHTGKLPGVQHAHISIIGNITSRNAGCGIDLSSIRNCLVAANASHDDARWGLRIENGDYLHVVGNSFNSVQDGPAAFLSPAALKVALSHNMLCDWTQRTTTPIAGGPNRGAVIHGNIQEAAGTYDRSGPNTAVAGNTQAL